MLTAAGVQTGRETKKLVRFPSHTDLASMTCACSVQRAEARQLPCSLVNLKVGVFGASIIEEAGR